MADIKGRYVKNADGTWTWVGSSVEELRYWYNVGLETGRREAAEKAK